MACLDALLSIANYPHMLLMHLMVKFLPLFLNYYSAKIKEIREDTLSDLLL